MKKILFVALAVMASASFSTIEAKSKKKKKEQNTVVPVQLNSSSDSLSYAAGISFTNGLIAYMVKQQGVDTAYMADFIAGFKDAVSAGLVPQQKARIAGIDIAGQVMNRMLPGMKREFTNTPDSIVDDIFYRGFTDALQNDTTILKMADAEALFNAKQQSNKEAKNKASRDAGQKFLSENKGKEGVITLPSGLQYKVLKQGDGIVPQRTDKVNVHYEGRLIDGTVFDASTKHGTQPASFRADQVIKGWTEALTMMPIGSKWQLYIPYQLAYGERGSGNIPPYAALIFDVELIGIDK